MLEYTKFDARPLAGFIYCFAWLSSGLCARQATKLTFSLCDLWLGAKCRSPLPPAMTTTATRRTTTLTTTTMGRVLALSQSDFQMR